MHRGLLGMEPTARGQSLFGRVAHKLDCLRRRAPLKGSARVSLMPEVRNLGGRRTLLRCLRSEVLRHILFVIRRRLAGEPLKLG
jgi:hypothetical protein